MKQKQRKNKTKKVLLGICGSIAAFKSCEIIRHLREKGCHVKCILTDAGQKFITPLTLRELCCDEVFTEMFPDKIKYKAEHITLSDWADIIVIAPATATTIAKLACGIADNLLTATVMASKSPVLICPAMNENMWNNPANQNNVERLKKFGYHFLGPEVGNLSCGKEGIGRLCEVSKILKKIFLI
ncbi:MAG: flavoprotein [Elusimicrobiota bacterium]